jgi:hypothetical protein
MNRLWLGVAILLLLMGIGILIGTASKDTHQQISDMLTDAARAAEAGDWIGANRAFFRAKQQWQRHRPGTAAVADHEPMEEIDRHFAQTEVYLTFHRQTDFCAGCRGLSVLTKAMGEAQSVSWWSLL